MGGSDPGSEGRRWLDQAVEDLDTARRLAEIGKHYASCFFAQQAAEKAIKAVLYARGAEIVRGHSVAELIDALSAVESGFSALRPRAAPLDAFYIPTRYPNGLPGGLPFETFGSAQSADALAMANDVLVAVQTRLAG